MEAPDDIIAKMLTDALKKGLAKVPVPDIVMESARKWEKEVSRRGKFGSVGEAMMAEKETQGALVKENIRYRAELREQKASKFPNIANVLTGGAASPVSMMGNIQRQASKPFKAAYDYKKSSTDLENFDRNNMMISPDSPEQDERNRLVKEKEGTGARVGKGFGKNLMGKRMQGMIGKVGKFMDSGKGQGMMAGGMMGASILTMIIKKAMEASPMLQQMLKIMNVAMTLFLRPIGDFIGGMLKPVMLFFLREVAIPMMKANKNMIKYGEVFGKQVLGFLLKPIETISTAITLAMNPFLTETERAMHEAFDGTKEWMTEQKMNVIANDLPNSRQEIQGMLNLEAQSKKMDVNALGVEFKLPNTKAENIAIANLERLRAEFKTDMEEFEVFYTGLVTNDYSAVDGLDSNVSSGPGALMGALATELQPLVTKTGELTSGFQGLIDLIPGVKKDEDPDVGDGKIAGLDAHVVEERLAAFADNVDTTFSDAVATINEFSNTAIPELEKSVIRVVDGKHEIVKSSGGGDYGPMLSKFSQFVMGQMEEHKKGSEEYEKAFTAYKEMTTGGALSVTGNASHGYTTSDKQEALEGLMEKFPDWKKQTQVATDVQEQMVENMKERSEFSGKELVIHESLLREAMGIGETKGMLNDEEILATKQSVLAAVNMAELNVDGYNAVQALIAQIAATRARMSYGGGGSSGGSGFSMVHGRILPLGNAAINYYRNLGVKVTQMQHGGMINEPIFGIGKSGKSYSFGEAGQEKVTPMFGDKAKGGGSIGPVNINVSIDSVKDDVDLEKIKPIVERALQEVHARRGII